jgi:hypothetical protein
MRLGLRRLDEDAGGCGHGRRDAGSLDRGTGDQRLGRSRRRASAGVRSLPAAGEPPGRRRRRHRRTDRPPQRAKPGRLLEGRPRPSLRPCPCPWRRPRRAVRAGGRPLPRRSRPLGRLRQRPRRSLGRSCQRAPVRPRSPRPPRHRRCETPAAARFRPPSRPVPSRPRRRAPRSRSGLPMPALAASVLAPLLAASRPGARTTRVDRTKAQPTAPPAATTTPEGSPVVRPVRAGASPGAGAGAEPGRDPLHLVASSVERCSVLQTIR